MHCIGPVWVREFGIEHTKSYCKWIDTPDEAESSPITYSRQTGDRIVGSVAFVSTLVNGIDDQIGQSEV